MNTEISYNPLQDWVLVSQIEEQNNELELSEEARKELAQIIKFQIHKVGPDVKNKDLKEGMATLLNPQSTIIEIESDNQKYLIVRESGILGYYN